MNCTTVNEFACDTVELISLEILISNNAYLVRNARSKMATAKSWSLIKKKKDLKPLIGTQGKSNVISVYNSILRIVYVLLLSLAIKKKREKLAQLFNHKTKFGTWKMNAYMLSTVISEDGERTNKCGQSGSDILLSCKWWWRQVSLFRVMRATLF